MRYALGLLGAKLHWHASWATLAANTLGCFVIGIIAQLAAKHLIDESTRTIYAVGFCGGFTTFSALSSESITLLKSQQYGMAVCYIAVSIALGMLAVVFGMRIADY
jgi:fluoride exporter